MSPIPIPKEISFVSNLESLPSASTADINAHTVARIGAAETHLERYNRSRGPSPDGNQRAR